MVGGMAVDSFTYSEGEGGGIDADLSPVVNILTSSTPFYYQIKKKSAPTGLDK